MNKANEQAHCNQKAAYHLCIFFQYIHLDDNNFSIVYCPFYFYYHQIMYNILSLTSGDGLSDSVMSTCQCILPMAEPVLAQQKLHPAIIPT